MRFLKDNGYKFLSDAECLLISKRILKLAEFIEECVSWVKTANGGVVLDSGKRLIMLEMKMFVLDQNIKIAVLVIENSVICSNKIICSVFLALKPIPLIYRYFVMPKGNCLNRLLSTIQICAKKLWLCLNMDYTSRKLRTETWTKSH